MIGEFIKKIEWNKDEFKALVKSITDKYVGIVYTDEQIKDAKEAKAALNKMKNAISDRRIEIKKAIMEPYDAFEADVKEIVALIEEPVSKIDEQIKEYEEEKKKEKYETIEKFYKDEFPDIEEIVEFNKIFDPRYLNQTFTIKKVKASIEEKVDCIRQDIKCLEESIDDERILVPAKTTYLNTLNLNAALSHAKKIETMFAEEEKKKEEIAKKQEQEKKEEEPKKPVEEVANDNDVLLKENETKEQTEELKEEKIYRTKFVAYGTREQILGLKKYMADNGIRVEKE